MIVEEETCVAQDDDVKLVRRAIDGDNSAFDVLVIRHTPKLYGLVYHMTANHEDTHDLLQDSFAKAYQALATFRGKSAFYTWLYSIAVRMTLDHLRRRKRRGNKVSLDELDYSALEKDGKLSHITSRVDTFKEVEIRELQSHLNRAMLKLTAEHRAVVVMYDIQGIAHAEISEILGVTSGTVRSRLHYAHKHLQTYLAKFHR